MNHRIVKSNGINMHLAEDGEGPLVVLCHGFPELWYSWRHQLKALTEAGYHVVGPDQRGYGQTDRPEAIDDYNVLQLCGDIVSLVDALRETEAVIVGHDWGSAVASRCAASELGQERGRRLARRVQPSPGRRCAPTLGVQLPAPPAKPCGHHWCSNTP
jgi:pimeloyl-ACP methyl ester carboxylesterase